MKKVIFLALILFMISIFFNIGKWLDVTESAVKSDIVVCLGGGTVERVKKSIELIEKGYANTFLLLGESWYNQPYIKKNYPHLAVAIDETPKNTMEEVLFIKKYMRKHAYKSALIVTDPPHTGRVKLLTSLLFVKGDKEMIFYMLGSDVKWWNAKYYYKSEYARNVVWHEVIGMLWGVLNSIPVLNG